MAIAHINNPDNVAPLPIPTTVLSEHLLVDGTSAAERVAGALDQLYDQRRFANAGALDIAESRLTKWQRRKFDADIEHTRGTMNGLLSALGIREKYWNSGTSGVIHSGAANAIGFRVRRGIGS